MQAMRAKCGHFLENLLLSTVLDLGFYVYLFLLFITNDCFLLFDWL